MNDLTVARYASNEIAKQDDFNFDAQSVIANLDVLFRQLFRATNDVLVRGMDAVETSTPSMAVNITRGLAYCTSTEKMANNEGTFGPLSIANGGASDRIDIIEVRSYEETFDSQQRAFRDPASGAITYQSWDTKTRYTIEAQVIQGVEGSGNAPNHTAGWIKLAEVLVLAGESTFILDANIKNVSSGYDTEPTAAWTSEVDATFILRPITYNKGFFRLQHNEDGDHSDDSIRAAHIDWGIGSGRVSAVNIPIEDLASVYSSGFIEGALQEIAGAGRTTETVKDNQDDIIDLAGAGRTTETVKQNQDDIDALEVDLYNKHTSTGDHKNDVIDSQHIVDNSIDTEHVNWGSGANQIDLDEVPDGTTYQRVHESYVDGSGYVTGIREQGPSLHTLQIKEIEIGEWNMNLTSTLLVPHGLIFRNIRGVSVTIRDDVDLEYRPLNASNLGGGVEGGVFLHGSTDIQMFRTTGGVFDGPGHDVPTVGGLNRGFITIWYLYIV